MLCMLNSMEVLFQIYIKIITELTIQDDNLRTSDSLSEPFSSSLSRASYLYEQTKMMKVNTNTLRGGVSSAIESR